MEHPPIDRPAVGAAIQLHRNRSLPLHVQAEQALHQLIDRPEYRDGRLLPDEVSLSQSLGISRNTLRAALGRLVSSGRIERRAGVGTRVVKPVVDSGVGAWRSFTREMQAKGINVKTFAINAKFVKAIRDAANALQVDPGVKLLCVDRVRGWDGEPEVRFRSWLHPRLGLVETDDFSRPLYELIFDRCRVVADETQDELTAVAADRRLARSLNVAVGTPLLQRVRTVFDSGGRPIEYAIVHYRGDRFKLSLNLNRQPRR